MTPKPPKPLRTSTARNLAAAILRSTKPGPKATVREVAGAAAAVVVMSAAVAAEDSPTKITANPRDSRANPAGNSRFVVTPVCMDLRGGSVTVTFQKRQKEMKRLEKQRAKAEKRAQNKEARRA